MDMSETVFERDAWPEKVMVKMADLLQRQAELGAGVLLEVDECGNVIAKVIPLDYAD